MWPIFQIGFGLIGLIVLFGVWGSDFKLAYFVSGNLGVSLMLAHAVYIPASFPGRDPNFFFIAAQKIVMTGSTEPIGLTFYGAAPGFLIYRVCHLRRHVVTGSPRERSLLHEYSDESPIGDFSVGCYRSV
jgi:hypothetical protein